MLPIWAGEQYISTRKHQQEVYGIHETILHINCKELLAAWLGLQCYASTLQDVRAHTSSDTQHSSSSLCEQNGRSAFQEPVSTSITGLGSVPPQEPYDFSRAPSRLTEPTGRQRVENRLGFFRMGTVHPDLPQTDGDEGPMYCGCLCIPSFSQTSNILQLEIGPRSKSSGCSNTVVEQHQRLCLPSILPNRQVSSQNQIREGTLGTVDHKLGFLYSQRCWCNLRSYFRATTC